MENVYKSETTPNRVEQMEKVHKEGLELFKKKNADYGDAFANYGAIGVLVRMGDKIQRLQSITSKNISLVNDEKIRDTLIDLHNYSAINSILLLYSYKNIVYFYINELIRIRYYSLFK